MSKLNQHEDDTAQPTTAHPPEVKDTALPKPLKALFAIVLLGGIFIGATRQTRTAQTIYDGMDACLASALPENNGLSDAYGIVKFALHESEVAGMLSLCDTDPPLAREIFRKALDKRSKSAQMIALYSAFFLAGSGQLENEDWDRLLGSLDPAKEKDAEVRKAAQRALSNLTFIADAADAAAYQTIPAGVKEDADKPSNRIQTHDEKLKPSSKAGLSIRWSNADLAFAWWTENRSKGQWDKTLQRYVMTSRGASTGK